MLKKFQEVLNVMPRILLFMHLHTLTLMYQQEVPIAMGEFLVLY